MSGSYGSDDAMNRSSPITPRPVITLTKTSHPVLPPIHASSRSLPYRLPSLEQIRTLPSIPSPQSPQPLCAATSPKFGSNNSQVLPPIRSALADSLPSIFPYSESVPSRDRQIPQFLPQQVPPGPFSHSSPVTTNNVSQKSFPARAAAFTRLHDMSYMTYVMTTEQDGSGSEKQVSLSSLPPANGVTGNDKCTHSGLTAVPFRFPPLVNSCANKHSQGRHHRCPIQNCHYHKRGFDRWHDMKRHLQTHQPSSYCCSFCGNMYARSDVRLRHVREQHRDENKNDPRLR
ncbi:hypothetical protein N7476_005062 [Penicillium atrosanguineum]|uniref:C2H2-type domain-containing protein n=1 Tax=Penicillium atrosanguineum TaxID=1132637 RepID=A0A9W9U799_9EURO|nr:hypothetical protein N7476_005062 [Penicillium atrosanguineum]